VAREVALRVPLDEPPLGVVALGEGGRVPAAAPTEAVGNSRIVLPPRAVFSLFHRLCGGAADHVSRSSPKNADGSTLRIPASLPSESE
jgi:hypothetical protein